MKNPTFSILFGLGMLAVAACGDESTTETVADGAFGATCETNEDCDSANCFEYGEKGKRCTEDCPADEAECPNDGLGCNNMGVCKVE